MKNLYPYFSQNPLDRLDQTRKNVKEVKKLKKLDSTLFILFDGDKILVNENTKTYLFLRTEVEEYITNDSEVILLGYFEGINYFAITVKKEVNKNLSKIPLRDFVNFDFIDESILGVLAQASSVLNWHDSHKFCSSCGQNTSIVHAGWRRDCNSCKKEHFPRVDSVVIMLVVFNDYCLIGRGVNFKVNRYSCLAGYVESGETLEDAARRELYEEVGIIGHKVEYMLSQPWPFPSTLMVGMRVEAKNQKLELDFNEISDAKWVHKNDIKAILNGDKSFGISIPDKIAIARNLLEIWVDE